MSTQQIIWTALPNGRDGDTLRLSVHVAPRLQTADGSDGALSHFPDFQDWPGTTAGISFGVSIGDADPVPASIVSPAPRSDLWTGLFKSTTKVRSHEFQDLTSRSVLSFPVDNIQGLIRDEYVDWAARSPEELPSAGRLAGGLLGELTTEPPPPGPMGPHSFTRAAAPADAEPYEDFQALRKFHQARAGNLLVTPQKPELDVHRVLSLASQHPALQRLLGIVFDLELTVEGLGTERVTAVRVTPSWTGGASTTTVRPATRTRLPDFRPAERDGSFELADGYLPFDDEFRFQLVQIDVDGAGEKVADLGFNLARRTDYETQDTPEPTGLPALQEAGLSIARKRRDIAFRTELVANRTLNSTFFDGGSPDPDGDLSAEDVTHAYRIDVHDSQSGRWHSLVRRVGEFRFPTLGTSVPDEGEGMVSSAPTSSADPDVEEDAKPLFLQETLFRWTGWSLVARRPGKAIANDPDLSEENTAVTNPASTAEDDFPVEIDFRAAPGTLPRLRYGNSYRLRARAVDIAGNSVPLDETGGDDHASNEIVYRRFDPVQAPTVLFRDPMTPGESDDVVVLRSNFDEKAKPKEVDRHIAPPKVPQIVAEHHGVLDSVIGADGVRHLVLDVDAYKDLVRRDPVTWANDHHAKPDPDGRAGLMYYPNGHMKVEYIPDPLAIGATFVGLPGLPAGESFQVPFGLHEWPKRETIEFQLEEGDAAPQAKNDGHKLTVEIPKGHVVRVRLSCHIPDGAEDLLGLWGWLGEDRPDTADDDMRALIRAGRHWMMTPHRWLTLVHAVRQPLKTPEFVDLQPHRSAGDTFARLTDTVDFSRTSTSRVDVRGTWTDPVDFGPGTVPPSTREVEADAFPLIVGHDPDPFDDALPIDDRHEFGDTKHRNVTYQAVATSRFGEYFFEHEDLDAKPGDTKGLAKDGFVRDSVSVLSRDRELRFVEGTGFTVDHDAGTVTFLAGDADSTPSHDEKVRVRFLARPITRVTADPPVVNILSTARPKAPEPVYVLPTFEWDDEPVLDADGHEIGHRSVRRGAGLRIYLERPWWSSGDGELLGVLLLPGDGSAELPRNLQGLVSEWGLDPVYGSDGMPAPHPTPAAFPDAVAAGTGLALDEVTAPVDVVGHTVTFDADRDLWFCDLRVDAGAAYSPFVRLALVRYQPDSLAGYELSRVVQVDFAHLSPDRTATVVNDPDDPTRFMVTVAGTSHTATEAGDGPGTAHVIVEKRHEKVEGEFAWEQVGDPHPLDPVEGGDAWHGEIVLAMEPEKKHDYRLVVEQFETLAAGDAETARDTADRLVYTDILPFQE